MTKKRLGPTQDLISQAEAARLRDVSRASISELIKRGRLAPIVIAGKVLVRRSDVLKFKELKRGRPKSEK
jgi:hypothetical protein